MNTQITLMKFDPATGAGKPYPSHAAQWRAHNGSTAWLFNPWTGARRCAEDVGSDPQGRAIQVDGEPVFAAPVAPSPSQSGGLFDTRYVQKAGPVSGDRLTPRQQLARDQLMRAFPDSAYSKLAADGASRDWVAMAKWIGVWPGEDPWALLVAAFPQRAAYYKDASRRSLTEEAARLGLTVPSLSDC